MNKPYWYCTHKRGALKDWEQWELVEDSSSGEPFARGAVIVGERGAFFYVHILPKPWQRIILYKHRAAMVFYQLDKAQRWAETVLRLEQA